MQGARTRGSGELTPSTPVRWGGLGVKRGEACGRVAPVRSVEERLFPGFLIGSDPGRRPPYSMPSGQV